MIVKFFSDKKEEHLIADVKEVHNTRFSDVNNYWFDENKEVIFKHENGKTFQSSSFDGFYISEDGKNKIIENKSCVPTATVIYNDGKIELFAFWEAYVMNDDGKTIDRL